MSSTILFSDSSFDVLSITGSELVLSTGVDAVIFEVVSSDSVVEAADSFFSLATIFV